MRMNTYPEYKLVQKCLQQIEDKLGWGDATAWHNDVFIELSETIQQHTHVLLSPTTLKRVWGRINYASAPSISTLNALSQFAGYINWRDFKNKQATKKTSWLSRKIVANIGVITTSAAIMTLVFISLYSMTGRSNTEALDFSKITFTSQPVTEGLPNSVVFNFDLDLIKSDSIHIQQFWDRTKTVSIRHDQKQATGIYYFPGYFRSKLLVDGQIIKEHDLFIKSNGWLGTIDYTPVPKYFDGANLTVPEPLLEEIARNEEYIVSSFHFVKDFDGISGDNLKIRTAVQNLYQDKWAVCKALRIVVLGTNGALSIPFSIPGCVSDIWLMLNERYWDGKEHDLSAFGIDMSKLRNIDVEVSKKKVTVSIDDNEIFNDSYEDSIGDFVGVRFRFLGAGKVAHISIKDENDNLILGHKNN